MPRLVAAANVARIEFDFDRASRVGNRAQFCGETRAVLEHRGGGFWFVRDRNDHHMRRRESWWQHHAVIIGVGHDHAADETCRHAPRRCPCKRNRAVGIAELDVARLREVLSEEVRRARLQRFAILHHRFDAIGRDRAGESLALGLLAFDDGHRHPVLCEISVNLEHFHGFHHGLFGSGVRGVSFLPQEFRGAQEQTRAHFPAHHVGPLIDEQRQIAVALHPLGETRADDRLRSWTHDQRLFEFARRHEAGLSVGFDSWLQTMMGNDRALFGEAVDVFRFLLQKRKRDEQREIRVAMSRVLEHAVEHALNVFPRRVSPRLDHHAAAHRTGLGQLGRTHDLLIPLGVVLAPCGRDRAGGDGSRGGGGGLLLILILVLDFVFWF